MFLYLPKLLALVITGYDFDVTVCRRVPREIWVRLYKKCNWDQVRESLASAPWNIMSIYDDLDDQWSFFHSIVMESLHLNAPLKRVRNLRGLHLGYLMLYWKR